MADEKGMSNDERKALREKLAIPILDAFGLWMKETYPAVLPKSRIGQDIAYSYSLWSRMKNYLKDRIAFSMIEDAEQKSVLKPGSVIRRHCRKSNET